VTVRTLVATWRIDRDESRRPRDAAGAGRRVASFRILRADVCGPERRGDHVTGRWRLTNADNRQARCGDERTGERIVRRPEHGAGREASPEVPRTNA